MSAFLVPRIFSLALFLLTAASQGEIEAAGKKNGRRPSRLQNGKARLRSTSAVTAQLSMPVISKKTFLRSSSSRLQGNPANSARAF